MKRIFTFITCLVLLTCTGKVSAQDFLITDASAFRIQSRFTGGVDFNFAPSITATDSILTPVTFNIKAGYRFEQTYILGTLGIEYMNGENFIPLGVELRQNFSTNDWSPFIYANAGYSLHLKRNIHSRSFTANYAQYDPSLFLKTGLGYSYASTLSEFYVSIGYIYHQLEEMMVEQTGEETKTDLTMNGLVFTLGFMF